MAEFPSPVGPLRAVAAALRAEADRLEQLASESENPSATIITVDNVSAEFPGLTPRGFADAGRRGDFAAFKSGRKLAAKRADVAAWIESRRVRPRAAKPQTIDPEAAYEALVAGGAH